MLLPYFQLYTLYTLYTFHYFALILAQFFNT